MLKNTFVIGALLILSIITYYLPDYLTGTDGSAQTLKTLAFIVSTVSFVLAIVGLVQKAKDKN
ncbi:MAG: hypothetical protein E6Q83_14985 [Thiothrix sp.]|nr:MAG: hypothetical protein E6Q83_14985 [Thiothrix sp.]